MPELDEEKKICQSSLNPSPTLVDVLFVVAVVVVAVVVVAVVDVVAVVVIAVFVVGGVLQVRS